LFERYGEGYRWLAVATIGLGTFSVLLMSTIVNVAIPEIMGSFGIGQNEAQWLSTGYLASSTVSMLMSSWCLTRFGVQNTFFSATLFFILTSLLAGMSNTNELLILARALQGFCYGFFLPLAMYLMARIFPPDKQGTGMGIFGILAVMGPAIGPYIGGLAVDALGWRSVFYIPLPMALLSLPLALLYLPGRDADSPKQNLDWVGIGWLSVCIIHFLVGLSNGQKYGWNSDLVVFCLTVATIAGLGFVYQQQRSASPLMDLSLFKDRNFRLAAYVSALFGGALFSGMYIVPLFLQSIQGLTATKAGLAMLPAGLLLTIAFPISGRLSDRLPPHWMLISGMLLMAYGTGVMVQADQFTGFVLICWWLVLSRVGMAMAMPALSVAAFSTLPQHQLTQASATSNFIRQMGGALGVNLTSVYLDRSTSYHMDYITSTQHAANPQTTSMLTQLTPALHDSGVEQALQEPLAAWILSRELYRQALSLGFQDTFLIAGIAVLAAIIPSFMLRHIKR
jgi:EmrB/QacA subfamily drug resistance transporter